MSAIPTNELEIELAERERPKPSEKDRRENLTVCFVCTGNTCRSPMAAALCNSLYGGHGVCAASELYASGEPERCGIRAVSAGIYANEGAPISQNAARALTEAGIESTPDNNYLAHTARNITPDIIESADCVVCMTSQHLMTLIGAFPEYSGKITSFPRDISDPYGGDIYRYDACLCEIRRALENMFGAAGKQRI